jgi:Spy/CpxP family protein refolding chaperone
MLMEVATMNRKTSIALAAIMAGLLASPAMAQSTSSAPAKTEAAPAPQTMHGGMMSDGMPMQGNGQGVMGAMIAGHVEGGIAFLKAELKITESQQKLWDAVADAMRANVKAMTEMSGGTMTTGATANLPDRLAANEKALNARLDALHKYKAVVDPLYAALSDEQKKTADELVPGMMGAGMMGMGMR